LLAEAQPAAAGPVLVAEIAVGIDAVGEFVGQLGQLVRAELGGLAGQLRFGALAGSS
jgi:hypothetical protein